MSDTIPSTMRAVLTAGGGKVVVKDVPTPVPAPGEILVKVSAIAQNPTDWKHAEFQPAGFILGVDYAGTVVNVTEGVEGLTVVGDRVAGLENGAYYADRGTMAEYLKADAGIVWKIPDSTNFEEAATMNGGLWTAIQGLFGHGRLELKGYPETVPSPSPWVLIYSGTTSVGQYAVQLAHLSGYRVVATTSPRNFDLVRSLGADEVIDYNDPDVVQRIKGVTGDTLAVGFDSISEPQTQHTVVQAFGPQGGKMVVVLQINETAQAARSDVEIIVVLLDTVFGRPSKFLDVSEVAASPADRLEMISWMPKITEMVGKGKLKPNAVKLWPGGLDSIKDGFEYMKAGKVHGEKIVYQP